jgi:hypothetical protein
MGEILQMTERRSDHRIRFSQGIAASMMAIDGTWQRPCTIQDVSETGAQLHVTASLNGLNLNEFFLLLSSTGLAFRRCELAWVNGELVGVSFLKDGRRPKTAA